MDIQAAIDLIAVKPLELSAISQGIFQAVSEKKPEIGEVVVIGKIGKKKLPFSNLKVGDRVLYRKYGSTNFIIGGREVAFIGFDDVVGKVTE